MSTEPRNLKVEGQQTGGEELLTPDERAAIEACLDLQRNQDTYTERAWRFVQPWLMKDQVKNVPGKQGVERLTALREQRRQLFQAVDRLRGGDIRRYIGKRQLERFQTTIKDNTYTFMNPLGAGAFGVTFDALQDGTNRDCVAKCMEVDPDNLLQSRKSVVEVATLRKLDGLHAPKLLDAQFQPDPKNKKHRMLVAVMERVHGEPGLETVRKYGSDQPDAVLQRVHTLLQAVRDIHQAGVLHLDLKPEHVFFSEDGTDATFIDYGLAHLPAVAEAQKRGTRPTSPTYGLIPEGMKAGTPSYAPADYTYTSKFDAFSVGRIIQAFLYKDPILDIEEKIAVFQKLPPRLQELSKLSEQMSVGRDQDRLDITAAMTLFEQNFPEFAQPEVATAETA